MSALASPSARPTRAIGTVGQGPLRLGSRGGRDSRSIPSCWTQKASSIAAVAVEVADDLVVVHVIARRFDLATGPRRPRSVVRPGVLPPVDPGAGVILAEDEVEVAVAVDVGGGTAGLDVEPAIDRVDRPAVLLPPIPGQARPLDPAADHDVVQAVLVDIEHQAGRLLDRRAGRGAGRPPCWRGGSRSVDLPPPLRPRRRAGRPACSTGRFSGS